MPSSDNEDASASADRAEGARDDAQQARDEAETARDAAQRSEDTASHLIEQVDVADPLLDTAVRRFVAGADEDKPYGTPGPPTKPFSPYRIGLVGDSAC